MFFLELLLTEKCNKNCYYCSFEKDYNNKVEADLDLLKYILKIYKDIPLFLELSGGEPGLISNLSDFVLEVISAKNCVKFQVMSNGLLRTRSIFESLFTDIYINSKLHLYNEHLIHDYTVNGPILHYDYKFLTGYNKYKNILILTPNTTKYCPIEFINNIKEFTIFKDLIPNTIGFPQKYNQYLSKFCVNNDSYHKHVANRYISNNFSRYNMYRKFCCMYPHNPSISFQRKKICHCTLFYHKAKKFEINKNNLLRLIQASLVNETVQYCVNCNFPDIYNEKYKMIVDARNKKRYCNRAWGCWYW